MPPDGEHVSNNYWRDVMTNPTVCFSGIDCEVLKKHYAINNQIAIQLVASDTQRNNEKGVSVGKSVCTATQFFITKRFPKSVTAISDYSKNRGVFDTLIMAGLIKETTRYIHEGSLYYPVVKVNF